MHFINAVCSPEVEGDPAWSIAGAPWWRSSKPRRLRSRASPIGATPRRWRSWARATCSEGKWSRRAMYWKGHWYLRQTIARRKSCCRRRRTGRGELARLPVNADSTLMSAQLQLFESRRAPTAGPCASVVAHAACRCACIPAVASKLSCRPVCRRRRCRRFVGTHSQWIPRRVEDLSRRRLRSRDRRCRSAAGDRTHYTVEYQHTRATSIPSAIAGDVAAIFGPIHDETRDRRGAARMARGARASSSSARACRSRARTGFDSAACRFVASVRAGAAVRRRHDQPQRLSDVPEPRWCAICSFTSSVIRGT